MRWPVIHRLRLAKSSAIAVPMSAGSPTRPSTVAAATASRIAGVSRTAPPRKSVAIAPGAIVLTVIETIGEYFARRLTP